MRLKRRIRAKNDSWVTLFYLKCTVERKKRNWEQGANDSTNNIVDDNDDENDGDGDGKLVKWLPYFMVAVCSGAIEVVKSEKETRLSEEVILLNCDHC